MSIRVRAALGLAGLFVALHHAPASADPPPGPIPGIGPCRTDPAPVHEDLIPETLEVPSPYPGDTVPPPQPPVPEPVRVEMTPPAAPDENPCPDLTDPPLPP